MINIIFSSKRTHGKTLFHKGNISETQSVCYNRHIATFSTDKIRIVHVWIHDNSDHEFNHINCI